MNGANGIIMIFFWFSSKNNTSLAHLCNAHIHQYRNGRRRNCSFLHGLEIVQAAHCPAKLRPLNGILPTDSADTLTLLHFTHQALPFMYRLEETIELATLLMRGHFSHNAQIHYCSILETERSFFRVTEAYRICQCFAYRINFQWISQASC